jgi:predicted hydrocarbon binding protein
MTATTTARLIWIGFLRIHFGLGWVGKHITFLNAVLPFNFQPKKLSCSYKHYIAPVPVEPELDTYKLGKQFISKNRKKHVAFVMKYKMLIPIEKNIEHYAGKEAAATVMEGSTNINEKTDKKKTALWTKAAMDRLDSTVNEPIRIQIMNKCGENCAEINKRVIQKALARRKKFDSTADFLKAEMENPQKGTRLLWEGKQLFQFYTPQAFTHPMRCYCGLIRALPSGTVMSKTYCHCAEGFVKKYWETVVGKPVGVQLVESAVSGASECKFAIHL